MNKGIYCGKKAEYMVEGTREPRTRRGERMIKYLIYTFIVVLVGSTMCYTLWSILW